MRMKNLVCGMILAVISTPAIAGDVIELTPGLWKSTAYLTTDARPVRMLETETEVCMSEDEATLTMEDIVAEIGDGQCEVTNSTYTLGRATADARCTYADMPLVTTGKLVGTWTSTAYSVRGDATFTGPMGQSQMKSFVDAQRIGSCN